MSVYAVGAFAVSTAAFIVLLLAAVVDLVGVVAAPPSPSLTPILKFIRLSAVLALELDLELELLTVLGMLLIGNWF